MCAPLSRLPAGKQIINVSSDTSSWYTEKEMTSSHAMQSMHVYEVRPRKDKRGVDLISDVLPFGRLCYGEPNAVSNAIGYAKFRSRSHDAMIRVYDEAGNVIETYEHAGDFKEW
jgi:hypothetical protein